MTDAVRPFMKWVGGKKQLLSELDKHVPAQFGEYIEPFVGGGALFFHLSATGRISKATLGDRNKDLIVTYRTVRDEVESLIRALRRYDHRYTKDHATRKLVFYGTRATKVPAYNKVAAAARVIFLNRTCYNGAYRVNLQGGFNVPMGRYANPTICDADNLRACAAALRPTTLDVADFAQTSECARAGDFLVRRPALRAAQRQQRLHRLHQGAVRAHRAGVRCHDCQTAETAWRARPAVQQRHATRSEALQGLRDAPCEGPPKHQQPK